METQQQQPNRFQRTMQRVARGLFGVDWGVGGDPSGWPAQQSWVRGTDMLRSPDTVDKPFVQVGPFQRVVSVISRDAASVPWEFFTVDADGEPSDEPVPNHPVSRLWSKPNGHMSGNQLMIGSYISKMVFGEYFWYYPKLSVGRRGSVRALEQSRGELMLLYPPNVKRKLLDDGTIAYALRDENGVEQPIDRAEVALQSVSALDSEESPDRGAPAGPVAQVPIEVVTGADHDQPSVGAFGRRLQRGCHRDRPGLEAPESAG